MHMRTLSTLTMTLWIGCVAAIAQRNALTPAEVAHFKEKLATHIRGMHSLESDFSQTKQLSYLEKPVESAGKLYFKAPDKIRWEYHTPEPSATVYDGSSAKRQKGIANVLSTTLTGGNIVDEARFSTAYYREGTRYVVVQSPREKTLSRYVKQVELTIDGNTFLISSVKITDPSMDQTTIVFSNQRKNSVIPENKFTAK